MNTFDIDPYKALKSIIEVTSPHLGKEFLKIVCEELKILFNAQKVLITEAIDYYPTTKVKILYSTQQSDPTDFELEGTPCKLVYDGKIIQITKDLKIIFEKETSTSYESFYGIPIHDKEANCIGHIAIFSEEKRTIPKEVEDIASIFTRRIETEYTRILLETQNEKILDDLYHLTIIDSLTQVHNRRFFTDKCSEVFSQIQRDVVKATLIFLDIDNFKLINDKYGHEEGDYVLKEVGSIFTSICRKDIDYISRIGGEEFAIISLNSNLDDALKLSTRLMKETENFFSEKKYTVTFSTGIVEFNNTYASWQDVYAQADKRMYEAKTSGKNRIKY